MAFKADSDDPRASLSYKFKNALAGLARAVLTTDPLVTTDPDSPATRRGDSAQRSPYLVHAARLLQERRSQASRWSTSGDCWRTPTYYLRALSRPRSNTGVLIGPIPNSTSSFRSTTKAENILATLRALSREVKTLARVLICYDRADDDTLPAVRSYPDAHAGLPVAFVRNQGRGAHARSDGRLCREHSPAGRGLPCRRRLQCRHPRPHGRARNGRLRYRLRQPLHAGRHHAGLPLAQGRAGAFRGGSRCTISRACRRTIRATASGCFPAG